MAVSAGFLTFVLEQLEQLGDVTSRRMFGGAGLYCGDVFFAVIDNDTLFFKVNEATVGPYKKAGMGPFQPYPDPDRPEVNFGYYQVPVGVLEDRDELVGWARAAVDVGRAKSGARRRRNSRGRRRV